LPEATDEELMRRAAAQGPEALALLFDRHHRKLFTFFVKLGHPRANAEDLVQDSFVRMLRYAASFRSDAKFLPWMYQLARNAAADAWRGRAREELHDDAALDALAVAAPDDPHSAQSLRETEQRLQRALLMLPRDKRELVLLSRVRQLDNDDLARLFGCSVNAVKVRLHRSLGELRACFDALENGPSSTHDAPRVELK
jgi:RNA polymerase sigma factor (sigma-70 family)